MSEKEHYVLGVLRACEFIAVQHDQPRMAADIIRSELIEGGFCTLATAKRMSTAEGIKLKNVWKEKSALTAVKNLAESSSFMHSMDCMMHVRQCGTCGRNEFAWTSQGVEDLWQRHECVIAKAKGETT
jgi:hypothetical protein